MFEKYDSVKQKISWQLVGVSKKKMIHQRFSMANHYFIENLLMGLGRQRATACHLYHCSIYHSTCRTVTCTDAESRQARKSQVDMR